jgi:hypothetical protein
VSVGHVARLLEEAGIATVILAVQAFQGRLAAMRVPRLLVSRYPMGRPVGAPGDAEGQRAAILAALELLQTAQQGGTIRTLPGAYRPHRA